jgi:RHS repeat-associated protein
VENDLSNTTTSYFNALNQMIESAPPSTTTQTPTTYTYDGVGNILTTTDGSGTTTDTYDADNRLMYVAYSNTQTGYVTPHAVTYSYDADGNRTQMTDGTGTMGATGYTTYTYDPLNRLESVTDGAAATVTYAYDPAGNNTCLSYANSGSVTCQNAISGTGLVDYGYDAANRTVTMADWVNPAIPTVFSYDNDSNLTYTTLPTTTSTTVTDTYDNADALTGVSGVSTLTRNADENIATTTPPSVSTDTYGYDSLNRVTAGTIPNDVSGATTSYTYDGASEITSVTPSGSSTTDYEYNSDGQLCWTATTTGSCTSPPTGATTYTYSTAGERLSASGSSSTPATYQWDQAGNLVCETVSNSSGFTCANPNVSYTTTFGYNGDGLRMSAVSPPSGTTSQCTWDVSGSVPRMLQAGSEAYLYGPNVGSAPIEDIAVGGGSHNYLVSDPTGVRELLSSGGSLSATVSYNSYGVPSGSLISSFGFEGGITDANGFIYLINRYYDPTTGQFLSVDPDVASTGQPYAYSGGDPVNASDPSGLFESGPNGQACIGQVCNWASQNTVAAENRVSAFDEAELQRMQGQTILHTIVPPVQSKNIPAPPPPLCNGTQGGGSCLAFSGGLNFLHDRDLIESDPNYSYWNSQSTDAIVRSLMEGSEEGSLLVNAAETILDGNTRVLILKDRGYDIDTLPREVYGPRPLIDEDGDGDGDGDFFVE